MKTGDEDFAERYKRIAKNVEAIKMASEKDPDFYKRIKESINEIIANGEITEYPERHTTGLISFEQTIEQGMIKGDLGIQIAEDGRVWICVDGKALIRFKPSQS